MSNELIFLIPLLPLICGALNAAFGMHLPRSLSIGLAIAGVAASTALTLFLWPLALNEGTRLTLYTWFSSGDLHVPFQILFNPLSAPMTLMVAGVSTLIHIYAAGYMAKEHDYARFFALLNLFVFAMLVIVLADNLLVLFLGWEGVGFCSYALIGFWYRKEANATAGRKAFLVTRVGDVFLGIALLWLFALTGTLSITNINALSSAFPPLIITILSVLLLLGACGKSAQLPLMTWLPDAMAGPTPVSALIHAATMVTAGAYLLYRFFPLISRSPSAMSTIALVGAATALYAATCALAQREIKRVLAYSTMSQVGYMFLAIGAGSVTASFFHLLTHAFFKALLFMAAGCVIHLAGEENDIYRMGGLRRKDPLVFWCFVAGALCLAGAPFTGGFFSKDAILLSVYSGTTPLSFTLWMAGAGTALLTALYTFRLLYLVFAGENRGSDRAHPLAAPMRWVLPPLALLGLGGGLLNLPLLLGGDEPLRHWLGSFGGHVFHVDHHTEILLFSLAGALFLLGWLCAHLRFYRSPVPSDSALARFFLAGWQADTLIDRTILGPFNWTSRFLWQGADLALIDGVLDGAGKLCLCGAAHLHRIATGRLSTYLGAFAWGLLLIVGYFLLTLVR